MERLPEGPKTAGLPMYPDNVDSGSNAMNKSHFLSVGQWFYFAVFFGIGFSPIGLAQVVVKDLGTLGGDQSIGFGINEAGAIVGESRTVAGDIHAFLWTERDGMMDLGTLGGDLSVGSGINNAGVIVGQSRTVNRMQSLDRE